MRVIAGTLRGRVLRAPRGDETRPTSDRVRESLFAILGDLAGARVLDLYAGTGALAIEAISRGAARATCVESGRHALTALRANLEDLGLRAEVTVVARRVAESLKSLAGSGESTAEAAFTLVFADPPYAMVPGGELARDVRALLASPIVARDARLVVEHATRDAAPILAGWIEDDARRWGDTAVSFQRRAAE